MAQHAHTLVLLAGVLAAGCRASMFDAMVRPSAGTVPAERVATGVVQEIPSPPFGPGWQDSLTHRVGAPYVVLADIDATSAGARAEALGRERVRREAAKVGGNAYVVISTRRDVVGPYSRTHGLALRVLAPMPNARARCLEQLRLPPDAADIVVACREAARLHPHEATLAAREALAHLALGAIASWDTTQRLPRPTGLQVDAAFGNASLAMARAAAREAQWRRAEPWLQGALPALGSDTVRAAQLLARRLAVTSLDVLRDSTAVAMALIGVQVAPSDAAVVSLAADLLRAAGRTRESFDVAARFAAREPARVEGWLLAGMAASALGENALAMRCFARVEQLDARYFTRRRMEPTRGADAEARSRRAAGRQPPATIETLVLPR